MSGGELVKLLALAALAVVTGQLLRGKTPAIALLLSLAAIVAMVVAFVPKLQTIWQELTGLIGSVGIEEQLFIPVVKVISITQLTHLSAEFCRDAGERAIAAKLELCGAAAALLCVLPLAKQALTLIGAFGT